MKNPRSRRYPPITPELRAQLMAVVPSGCNGEDMRPCQVTLVDGRVVDRVYVMEQGMYITWWGVWPEDDRGKQSLPIDQVTRIEESPSRLPVAIANTLYEAGESGMGYCIFTLVLRNGHRLPYVTGNAVDFVDLPPGVRPADVVRVLPHVGRKHFTSHRMPPHSQGAAYFWCLYSEAPD